MNLTNFLDLTVCVEDYNLVAANPDLMCQIRNLTLSPGSGMNYELDNFERLSAFRPINCELVLAHNARRLIGWALLSKEHSNFPFSNAWNGFSPRDGTLFQIYVHPAYRKRGVASEILKTAKQHVKDGLCVCPHDFISESFYTKFKDYHSKVL